MRLGLDGGTILKTDLPTTIRMCRESGFAFLELWKDKLDAYLKENSAADLKRVLDAHGVHAESINSLKYATLREGKDLSRIKEECDHLARAGKDLGIKTILAIPSPRIEGMGWETCRDRSAAVLNELADITQSYGLRLALEFLGFDWCSINRIDQCREILDICGRPDVGMVVDVIHYARGGSTLDMLRALDPDRIFMVHIDDLENKDNAHIDDDRVFPGQGMLPIPEFLAGLNHIGYDGPVAVELLRPAYWEKDPAWTAREAFNTSKSVLEAAGCHLEEANR